MQDPEISVILPVCDGQATVASALTSVLASRGVELELICIDDGSRDDTGRILREFALRDTRVRIQRTEGKGLVEALNLGVSTARAPLLARMDADDEVHPERLEAQKALLDAKPELGLVGCRVESFRDADEGGLAEGYRIYTDWVNTLVAHDEILREAFIECPVPHPTWMMRREVLNATGGYQDHGWPEDLDLLYRVLASGWRIEKVPCVLHRWRDHSGRLSRVDERYAREAFARCKAHHLTRLHAMPAAVIWGAGKTGRRMVRLLEAEGLETRALIDIHPDRIGSRWRGIPILGPDQLGARVPVWRQEGLRILGAVASRGGRGEIRQALVAQGLRESEDFLLMA